MSLETLDQRAKDGTQAAGKALESPRGPGIMELTVEVPDGAPEWVTAELLEEAIDVWQPYYEERLTARDALEITLSVGRLADIAKAEGRS